MHSSITDRIPPSAAPLEPAQLRPASRGWRLWGLAVCLAGAIGPVAAQDARPAAEFPSELTKFAPLPGNPRFEPRGAGTWEVKLRERGWILRDGDQWRLWYTGYDGTPEGRKLLGYATSRDGLTWNRAGDKPAYADHWVEDMMVVKQGETFYMFAEGERDQAQLLTSRDGVAWTRQGQLDVRYVNGEPLSAGPYGTPTAWHEDGTWWLFYERRDAGVWAAKSTDLKVWTNVQDEPVLSPGPADYDKLMIAMNQIVKYRGRYYAYYHGTGTPEKPRLWTTNIAVSDDLLHWRKFAGNPLLPEKDNRSSGFVVPLGPEKFRLYTLHERMDVYEPARE